MFHDLWLLDVVLKSPHSFLETLVNNQNVAIFSESYTP